MTFILHWFRNNTLAIIITASNFHGTASKFYFESGRSDTNCTREAHQETSFYIQAETIESLKKLICDLKKRQERLTWNLVFAERGWLRATVSGNAILTIRRPGFLQSGQKNNSDHNFEQSNKAFILWTFLNLLTISQNSIYSVVRSQNIQLTKLVSQ